MRFMAIYKPGFEADGPADRRRRWPTWARSSREMTQKGVLIMTDGLQHSKKGARVSVKNGTFTVTDGPFTETKELVARLRHHRGALEGRGHRVDEALPERRRTRRERDPVDAGRARGGGAGLKARSHVRRRRRCDS